MTRWTAAQIRRMTLDQWLTRNGRPLPDLNEEARKIAQNIKDWEGDTLTAVERMSPREKGWLFVGLSKWWVSKKVDMLIKRWRKRK